MLLLPALVLGLSPQPRVAPPARMSLAAAVAPETAGHAVAQWCVSAGRAEATVAVSRASTLAGVLADFWLTARSFSEEEGAVAWLLSLREVA